MYNFNIGKVWNGRIRNALGSLMVISLILGVNRTCDIYFSDGNLFAETNMPRVIASYICYVLGPAAEVAFLSMAVSDIRNLNLMAIPIW